MLRIQIYNVLLLLALLFLSRLNAQNDNALEPKQNLSISDNLPHNGVTSIIEDSKGYLWIGTYDGLSKYDGYNIKVYKNTVNKQILLSNRIRSIAEDDQNNIWIGTDNGISIYNTSKEKFNNLYSNKTNSTT